MIVAGLGSRKGATQVQVLAAIDAALAAHGLARGDLDRLATAPLKQHEAGLRAAAAALRLELAIVGQVSLEEVSDRILTASTLSAAHAGTPSVSEASALLAAGPEAKLLGPRLAVGPVTCAIAIAETP